MKRGFRLGVIPVALLLSTASVMAANVWDTRIEVFISSDKGYLTGQLFEATDGQNALSVDLTGYEPGVYTIGFRAFSDESHRDATNTVTRLLYIIDEASILGAEYFIDDDPGIGKGNIIPVVNGPISFILPTFNLSIGVHTLNVRIQDDSGAWGTVVSRTFVVIPDSMILEWFIDADPGIGSGNCIDATTGKNVYLLPLEGVSAGVHTLGLRSCNQTGVWSNTLTRLLYVAEPDPTEYVAAEYYIDNDPGEGLATSVGISRDGCTFAVPTESLDVGDHSLVLRGRYDTGVWATVLAAPFRVTTPGGVAQIEWLHDMKAVRQGHVLTLTGSSVLDGAKITVYGLDGKIVCQGTWCGTDRQEINVSGSSPLLVHVTDTQGRVSVIKTL